MKAAEFKRKYRASIAPQFDKVKDPTPELLKAIIDLERMVAELEECSCPGGPFGLPRPPVDPMPKLPHYPPYGPPPFLPPRDPPWKLPEVWCKFDEGGRPYAKAQ